MQLGLHLEAPSKEDGRFESSLGSASSRRVSAKFVGPIDSSECRRSYFVKKNDFVPSCRCAFPRNAQGTTWTLRVAGLNPARRASPGGSSVTEQQATSPPFLSPLFFLHRCAPRWKPGLISPSAKVRLLPQRRPGVDGVHGGQRSEVNVPESSNGRTRGFDPRDEGSTPSSGADRHMGVAQWWSARFGTERMRVRFSPPILTRGSSSGDGSCLTNRLRRVRSSRPVPSANVAQLAEAAASNPAP